MEIPCQVCARDKAIGVASSGLGAVSLAYCRECAESYAEPEFMFACTAEMCGEDVAEFVKEMRTFKDGRYLTWSEWLATPEGQGALAAGRAP